MNILSTYYWLRKLRKNHRIETEKLRKIQLMKLRALINYVYKYVPYYKELFDSIRLKPEDIVTIDDLLKIPVTTKSKLKSLPVEKITSRKVNLRRCVNQRTSGSTGEPFTIFYSRNERIFNSIKWAVVYLENGVKYRDKRVAVYEMDTQDKKDFWFKRLGFWNNVNISCFDPLDSQISLLRNIKPDFICGFPSSLSLLALEIKKRKINDIKPKAVFTSAEILDQKTRSLLDSVFSVKTVDFYGSCEFGPIAWECSEHKGYHINLDTLIVEFVKDGKLVPMGEIGEVVCTSLHSYTMPFIRYSVGDIGSLINERCSCGRVLPLMKRVEGRLVDQIILPSLKVVSPYSLTLAMEKIQGIFRYQIIQERKEKITVKFIKDMSFSKDTLQQIKRELKEILKEDIEINPIMVDEISGEKSGKFKVVMSKVNYKQDR